MKTNNKEIVGIGCIPIQYRMNRVDNGIEFGISDNYACVDCIVPDDTWACIIEAIDSNAESGEWNVSSKLGRTVQISISDEISDFIDDACSVMLHDGAVSSCIETHARSLADDMRKVMQ